ncbi:DUF5675 family protein [Gelidibacter japonicus]|uniref:DUF5675 family protein n=1 Tax=Gelidibacter japonicus TaxID=1962232 RepID=UPI003A9168F6
MEFNLTRVYKSGGTNGTLTLNGQFVCFTIELPWRENAKNISCISEGVYELQPRLSIKHKAHLQVLDVYNRSQILIHAANDALVELQGCIAPVMQLTGIGTGIQSQRALQKLLSLCHQARDRKEQILLNINSNRYEYLKQIQQTNA